jgi:hypothetical protein
MKINKFIKLLMFFIVTTVATAQQVYLETGKTSSSFDYKDSNGMELNNLQATTHSFMTMGYRTKLFTEKLKTSLGVGYFGYGATGSDDTLDGILEWNANYLEFSVSLDYSLFKKERLELYLKGMTSTGFLIHGNQSLYNEIINLKNIDDFDRPMVSFKAGVGFLYQVSTELTFYVQYLYAKSLNQASHRDSEILRIKSHNMSFGVLIGLFKNS